jgi:peptidoglycan/xylan/chitin deacetylase (PgdA/CDA1 family)
MFDEKKWKLTCYAVGKAVEGHPDVIRYMHQQGHEIASHNYRWIDYKELDEETERTHIRKCVGAIQVLSRC